MSEHLCGVCTVRIQRKDGKNKLRAAWLWPKIKKLAEFRNASFNKEDYICGICRNLLFKVIIPTNPDAAKIFHFKSDPIVKRPKRGNNLRAWQDIEITRDAHSDVHIANDETENHSLNSTLSSTSNSNSNIDIANDEIENPSLKSTLNSSHTSNSDADIIDDEIDNTDKVDSSCSTSQSGLIPSTSTSENTVSSQASSRISQRNEETYSYHIASCSRSQRYCFICKDITGRASVTAKARVDVFIKRKIIIPEKNRCCNWHLKSTGYFTEESLDMIIAKSSDTKMTPEDMSTFLLQVSESKEKIHSTLDFDEDRYSDYEFKMLLGITKENFEQLLIICTPYLRESKNRSRRNALAIFFIKLRLNISQHVIALMFGMPSQSSVSETFNKVMDVLHENFVPKYLGYQHISRNDAKHKHQAIVATSLHEIPEVSLGYTIDGTYLPCEKPSSLVAQRELYSGQKLCCLVKPMMLTFTNGYILDMPKCYPGKMNDARILNEILLHPDGIFTFVKSGDYFFLDRGFRDSTGPLEAKNINIITPPCLEQGQHQFTTEQANRQRLVTMARFVVEIVNGRIKMKFKMFNDTIKATYLPKINKLFRIACAVFNAFGSPIISNQQDADTIIDLALAKNLNSNELAEYVKTNELEGKRVIWVPASLQTIESFPQLTLPDMKMITLGTYQTSLASRYVRQHLSHTSEFKIFVHREKRNLLRAKIQSRFRGSTCHQLWIQFDPEKNGHNSILGYYCKCKVGERTVGTCAHVASVIYFLGYCRYNVENLPKVRDLVSTIVNSLD